MLWQESFAQETEGKVKIDRWITGEVGAPELLKVKLECNFAEIIKDALYIKYIHELVPSFKLNCKYDIQFTYYSVLTNHEFLLDDQLQYN